MIIRPLIGFLTFLGEIKHLVNTVSDCRDVLSRSLNVEYSTDLIYIMANQDKKSIPTKNINKFVSDIQNRNTYLKSDAKLIFLCGKKPNKVNKGARDLIFEYANKHMNNFQFFMAETFFENFNNHDNLDLLTLEDKLADIADCVVIVLESESTFAELGAFALSDRLVKSLLVINDKGFENSNSFITHGPIAKVNKKSKFKPVIHTNLKSILSVIPQLEYQLNSIRKQNNKKIEIKTYSDFDSLNAKVRMLFILDLITIFHPVSLIEIIEILRELYQKEYFDINIEINMLEVLKLIVKKHEYFIRTTDDQKLFFDITGFNEIRNRAEIINFYHKYNYRKVDALLYKIGTAN